ncbi:hypothetical protein [Thalassospira australica]|uniref:hypothetical protein n=1 Tax=Thalassospira australica TaxID=1528106 RepID=UPI00384B6056
MDKIDLFALASQLAKSLHSSLKRLGLIVIYLALLSLLAEPEATLLFFKAFFKLEIRDQAQLTRQGLLLLFFAASIWTGIRFLFAILPGKSGVASSPDKTNDIGAK